jgi:hypothetical protein
MEARVCAIVLGGVFLKARERHERAKEKIPGESGEYSKGWNVPRHFKCEYFS